MKSSSNNPARRDFEVFEAANHLSELVQRVLNGESFCLTKRRKRVAELRPVESNEELLTRGCAADFGFWMAVDFDGSLTDFDDYE